MRRFPSRVLPPAGALLAVVLLAGSSPESGRHLSPVDVQQTTNPTGDSPWLGQRVHLEGVVTGISPHGRFYYLADPGGGPWSGLKVEGEALRRQPGETVSVVGIVAEVGGETRLEERSAAGRGEGPMPPPAEVRISDLRSSPERWEGVLVRIADVTVIGWTSDAGEFPVRDASGSLMVVGDEFFHPYIADVGDTFGAMTGLVSFSGAFRLEPRSARDLERWTSVRSFDASLVVTVRDEHGRLLPSKVTLRRPGGPRPVLGPDDRAEGGEDVAYVEQGRRVIPLPSGTYDVVVSRGIEYGLWEETVTVPPGGEARVDATLRREVDTRGWLSGDFHLHAAPSPDSPLPVPGRIASLAGEGVEWAVATDHNRITDYRPVTASLGLEEWIMSSIGDEITTRAPSFGHFNAWPLRAGSVPPPWSGQTPASLFAAAEADPGIEVVQVNHPVVPSWGDQYFQVYEVSRFTGEPGRPGFSFDFDALELFNGRYLDDGISNFETWMRMANNGRRITATGNSDSHHLVFSEPGYPRNYVASATDEPGDADEDALVAAVLGGRTFLTYGPFVELTVNGAGLGETVGAPEGIVRLRARIRCASWIRLTEARVYANAEVRATFPLEPAGGGPFETVIEWVDAPERDTWYLLYVDGEEDLSPVRRGGGIRPLAITNPVWVDVDGSGGFDPPGNAADAVTIAELDVVDANGVPSRAGDWVSVTGCATTDTRFSDPASGLFYVDDGTGGVQVRERVDSLTEVQRGDRVRASGYVAQLLGETVLTECVIERLGVDGTCPEAGHTTTGAIAGGAGVESLEGRVVRITAARLVAGSWPTGGAEGAVTIDDGSGPVMLWIPPGVLVPGEVGGLPDLSFPALVTQRAFAPPYLTGYRLTLRDGADLLGPGPLTGAEAGPTGSGPVFGAPHPNPFRETVRVPVREWASGVTPRVEVLDVAGRRIRSLVPERRGSGEIVWDGRDEGGAAAADGVYYLRMTDGGEGRTVRIVKLR